MLVALSMSIRTSYYHPIPSPHPLWLGDLYIYIYYRGTSLHYSLAAARALMCDGGGGRGVSHEKRKKLTCEADGGL